MTVFSAGDARESGITVNATFLLDLKSPHKFLPVTRIFAPKLLVVSVAGGTIEKANAMFP
jgi:hypothetical protein